MSDEKARTEQYPRIWVSLSIQVIFFAYLFWSICCYWWFIRHEQIELEVERATTLWSIMLQRSAIGRQRMRHHLRSQQHFPPKRIFHVPINSHDLKYRH